MKCTFCGAPLPINGLICSYCGQRNAVNLRSLSAKKLITEDELACPICDTSLERMDIGLREIMIVHSCDDCDGLFLKCEDLKKTIDAQGEGVTRINPKLLRFVLDNPRHEKQVKKRFYRKCPYCDHMMDRVNYKAVSGVIIDKCHQHGVWLDAGELQQLFDWKKVGGELKASNKEYDYSAMKISNYKSSKFLPDPIEDFFMWLGGV
jgi:Zn-finger nucleic acid-binding protein